MKFSVPSFARALLAFALVVSVPSCDGIDKDSENTETPDDNGSGGKPCVLRIDFL